MKHAGLIGAPVAHSLSPRMQQAAFDACGIEARYTLWETNQESLPARIASLRAPEMLGANVTIPYKVAALPLIDECDSLAARVGAINTIVNRAGRLIGYNTDVQGFMQALTMNPRQPFESQGKSVVIVGTGGVARAAAVGLLEGGIRELTLLGRTEAHLAAIHEHLHRLAERSVSGAGRSHEVRIHAAILDSADAPLFLGQTDLLVNATPVGLHESDARILVEIHRLSTTALVMDLIFKPPQTPLLRAAQAHGCEALNGLPMLLYQGALAFALWTGLPAPVAVMRAALDCKTGSMPG